MSEKLPISVLIASCNDGPLLEDCLKSLWFCDEILLVDLESTDSSLEIAKAYNTSIHQHKKVELVEFLFPEFIPKLKNDWVMLIDPDERIDPELETDIRDFFKDIPVDCGRINVPIVYYYKNKALRGTVWGGNKSGRLLIKQSACHIGNNVHTAIQLKEGFITYKIKEKSTMLTIISGFNPMNKCWKNIKDTYTKRGKPDLIKVRDIHFLKQ